MSEPSLQDRAAAFFRELQQRITTALEELDGSARFLEDRWERGGGGGGFTRVLTGGALFEKAGVNFSDVAGDLAEDFARQLPGTGTRFRAVGVSLVLHPRSPMVPTVHANFRMLEHGDRRWFGGGADLTPTYPFPDDVLHFHRTLRAACDRHDPDHYARFKKWCDEYFFLPHRGETRGVGGLFFDWLEGDLERTFAFVKDVGAAFLDAYLPLAVRRRDEPHGEREREFQLYRRGRYVEFNLLHDRGTMFGLKTGGRTESILMSLPPLARWEYGFQPAPGSREAELTDYLRPRDWLTEAP
ncbi:MAG: oxygen-dependent coproporphyrinogen oxidase [Myxococcales bacterium]|nr:oxygen-dependent coproporphyrinogen oxidase [Myxococcales bacterium]